MRIAVIGYGYWGPKVVRCLSRLLGPERVAVCETHAARAEAARQDHPGLAVLRNWYEVLADPSIDAVYLCTPASAHYPMALDALAADKHLLIEKPMTTVLSQAVELFDQAAHRGLALMAGHVFRYSEPLRSLREVIEAGDLGEPRYVYSTRTSLGPRVREEVSVVWDYLVHDAYLLPYLLGQPPHEVSAYGGSYLLRPNPDVVFARLGFEGGLFAACQASWYDPQKVRRLCVVGSERMAVCEDGRLTLFDSGYAPHEGYDSFGNHNLRLYESDGRLVATEGEEPLAAQARAFLEAAAAGRAPAGHAEEVLASLAILEAVDRSLQEGGKNVGVRYPQREHTLARP